MSYTKLTDFAAKDALLSGNPSKLLRGTEIGAEFDAIESAMAAAEAVNITAPIIAASTSKTTPVNADVLPILDSAAANILKKVTWANVKATLKTYFDTLYAAVGAFAASGANADITSLSGLTSVNGGQLAGLRNRIINGNFGINQRGYVSGAAVGAGLYGHDRWKMAASGDTYTFSTTANVTTITIPAGKVLQQVIEGLNLETGTYTLSWSGTAQGKIGAGSYGASGITGSITGGTNTTIEFGPGTVSKVQLEFGGTVSVFEQRPYGMELALCQRYFENLSPSTVMFPWASGTQTVLNHISFKVTKRAVPTIAVTGASGSTGTANALSYTPTVDGLVVSFSGNISNYLSYTGGTAVSEL